MYELLWGNQREVTVLRWLCGTCDAHSVALRWRCARARERPGLQLPMRAWCCSSGASADISRTQCCSGLFKLCTCFPRLILWAINITETFPRDRRGIHVFARLPLIRNGSACPGCSGASSSSSPSCSSSVELLPFLPLPSTSVVSWCSLKRVCQVTKNVIGYSTPAEQQGF